MPAQIVVALLHVVVQFTSHKLKYYCLVTSIPALLLLLVIYICHRVNETTGVNYSVRFEKLLLCLIYIY